MDVKSTLTSSREDPIQAVDMARSFCIYLVVQKHLILSALVSKPVSVWASWVFLRLCENGIYGVYLFFVISGFLITRLADRMPGGLFGFDLASFYIRRVARIVPLFLLTVLVGISFWLLSKPGQAASVFCFNLPAVREPVFWLSLCTFSFNWYCVAHPSIYFAQGFHWILLWSLSVEEQFYLFYPLILLGLRKLGKLKWILAGFWISGPIFRWACIRFDPGHPLLLSISTPAVWDCIAAGALIYLISKKTTIYLTDRKAFPIFLSVFGILWVAVICLATRMSRPADQVLAPTLLGMGLGLFLLGALSLKGFQNKTPRFLGWPGRWSYGIYLTHVAVLFVLWPALKGRTLFQCGLLYGLALMATAATSFYLYERPLNRWVRRRGGEVERR